MKWILALLVGLGLMVPAQASPPLGTTWGSDGSTIYSVVFTTGVCTSIGSDVNTAVGLSYAYDKSTASLYELSINGKLYSFPTANTSSVTFIGDTGLVTSLGYAPNGLAYYSGKLYTVAYDTLGGNSYLYKIDQTNASTTLIGTSAAESLVGLYKFGTTLYAVNNTNDFKLYSVNPSTGAGTAIGLCSADLALGYYNLTPGQFAGTDGTYFYKINPSTGATTVLATAGAYLTSLTTK